MRARGYRGATVAVAGLALLAGCEPSRPVSRSAEHTATIEGPTMGTHFTVKLRHPDESVLDRAAKRIPEILQRIDDMMSTYKADSELSRFNQHASLEPFPVSPEMIEIFRAAKEVSASTGGAFDVTVGSLVNAWGFGPVKSTTPPTDAEIAELIPRVGYTMVNIDAASSTLSKSLPDLYCDLSGIAQGFAADKVAEALDELGIANYMVDISGEFRTRGVNNSGKPWQIAIERPDAGARTAQLIVPLSNLSMATSGDYRNYREVDGRRISHEIDPKTGRPIAHKLASASVITRKCTLADAYATALMVLGPEEGYEVADRLGLAAYFIIRTDDGGFEERSTPQFDALMATAVTG